jgi:hypothetical protein
MLATAVGPVIAAPLVATGSAAGASSVSPTTQANVDPLAAFVQQDALRGFIQSMAQRHGFDADALERLLSKAQRSDAAIRLSAPTPPGMTPSWNAYRSRFIEPIRLRHGLDFWRENATALARAERQYGVPAEVIAAVIGVETIYGRNTGQFRILDVLLTLAFVDGRRPELYRDELEAFLLWTREAGIDPLEPRGSYAGAIGLPQFMPSSIRRWAVDFDVERAVSGVVIQTQDSSVVQVRVGHSTDPLENAICAQNRTVVTAGNNNITCSSAMLGRYLFVIGTGNTVLVLNDVRTLGAPTAQCAAGTYKPLVGNTNCTACPAFSTSVVGATSIAQCSCRAGYLDVWS